MRRASRARMSSCQRRYIDGTDRGLSAPMIQTKSTPGAAPCTSQGDRIMGEAGADLRLQSPLRRPARIPRAIACAGRGMRADRSGSPAITASRIARRDQPPGADRSSRFLAAPSRATSMVAAVRRGLNEPPISPIRWPGGPVRQAHGHGGGWPATAHLKVRPCTVPCAASSSASCSAWSARR